MSFRLPTRLAAIGPSQIRENMRIASEVGAVNLAQGRPDFPTAPSVKMAAIQAIADDHNQYSVTWGVPELRDAVSAMLKRRFGVSADPTTDLTITCGVTEAIVAAMLALVEPGDEVIVMEPAHENYVPAVRFAGGVPRFITMRPPDFALPIDALRRVISNKTRALILNTPHNPSGHVFTRAEILEILSVTEQFGTYLVTDEIYDHLTYPPHQHVCPASLAPDSDLLVTTGGISKIYAATGWRLGYVAARKSVSAALRTVHDYLAICAPTPFQHAALTALDLPTSYYQELRADFLKRRDTMMRIAARTGFVPHEPEGAYYLLAGFEDWKFDGGSEAFTRFLIEEGGLALVPGSAFYYQDRQLGDRLVRFAFAKTVDVLQSIEPKLLEARPK